MKRILKKVVHLFRKPLKPKSTGFTCSLEHKAMLYQQVSDEVDREFLNDTYTRLLEPFVFDEDSRKKMVSGIEAIQNGTLKYPDLHDAMERACVDTIAERFVAKGGILLDGSEAYKVRAIRDYLIK